MSDWQGWLFLMQHYGVPTRLLDWSESILVATYFAVHDPVHDGSPGDIWALFPSRMNRVNVRRSHILHSRAPVVVELIETLFKKTRTARKKPPSAAALTPHQYDLRMAVQQSVFTIHSTAVPLNRMPHGSEYLARFVIPSSGKPKLRSDLESMGVSRRMLFPDLDNLALAIKMNGYSSGLLREPS